ncbi:TPA: pyridoxal-phosphate dependent enzyme [Candidatus Poribacteria bacterium]|nr:pyridoxal-phosphate dependent enzyme [Candidatus Poribacteria bacterium]
MVSAQQEQGDVIRKTSLTFSDTFTQLTGSTVYLKNEFEQKTGSFKLRGAYYKIKTLSEEERKNGVVAASAGNHAQGVAYASALEKINCTIVMPKNASPAKVAARHVHRGGRGLLSVHTAGGGDRRAEKGFRR